MRIKWTYILSSIAGVVVIGILGPLYVVFYASCPTVAEKPAVRAQSNFVFDKAEWTGKSRLVVLIPGALNSIDIFANARALNEHGFGTAFYRFPGMDGRPLDQIVSIDDIAQEVVGFSNLFPDKEIYVVGFSVGAQVALEAAARSKGRIKKVVILSGSMGFPSTFGTGFRAMNWVVRRAWATGTMDLASVWKDFYKVLLFGEAGVTDPALARRASEIIAARRDKIVVPTRALVCSHMRDITFRSAVDPGTLGDMPILFVHGRWDVVSPVKRLAAYARNFRVHHIEVLEGQGHQIFLTERALFKRVGEFLEN